MIHVQMTDEQRRDLEQVSRLAVGRVALRAHMVVFSARGYSVPQSAAIHDCGCDVVHHWLHHYAQEGVAGLDDAPRSGRPPKHPLVERLSATQAGQSPECSGHVPSCWTVGLRTASLAQRFRLVLSCSSVRRYLQQRDGRWARPRLAPAQKTDPEAPAKKAALVTARQEAAQGRAHLFDVDECNRHLLPVTRALWLKGPRVRVLTPGTNARRAFCGALEAVSGQWFSTDHDRKLAVPVVAFLTQLAVAYPTGPLYLALDNVKRHDATVVRAWLAAHPRVQVLWLPKDAAHEVNPVERIWGLMKDDVAAHRLAGSSEELTAKARRFCADLGAHPVSLPLAA
jgi:transposase